MIDVERSVMLSEIIGEAAMLEQTAEELTECAQACLKLARYKRGENPTFKDYDKILDNLHEEIADVHICFNELQQSEVIDDKAVLKHIQLKIKRMLKRMTTEQIKEILKKRG